jgi:uncharacterized lipoprotein YehR (DUF1307 family)
MQILRTISAIVALVGTMMLAGCGKSISGVYVGQVAFGGGLAKADFTVEFSPNGSVFVRALGQEHAGKYHIEGNRIIVEMPRETEVFTIVDDETLTALIQNGATTFKKQR